MNAFLVGSAIAALAGPPVPPRFEAFHKGAADNTSTPSAGYALTHRPSAVDPAAARAPELRFPFNTADDPGRRNPVFPEFRLLMIVSRTRFDPAWMPVVMPGGGPRPDVIGASADYPALQLAAQLAHPTAQRTDPAPAPDVAAELIRVAKERARVFDFRDDALHRLMVECEASAFPDSVDAGRWLRSQGLK